MAGQQKSLDFLALTVLDSRIALDDLLAEQGVVCATPSTSCCPWINTSGIAANTKVNKHATWLKQVHVLSGIFFDLFDTNWFGSWEALAKKYLKSLSIILSFQSSD